VLQPGSNVGGIGMGVVRMVRPWNEWLLIWGYDITQPAPSVTREICEQLARQLIGDNEIPIDITSWSTWTVNHMHATRYRSGRVFCMGDAVHRHPPSNGLGSNTSIQDAYNLAWKLAAVLKGHADPRLLDSYDAERAPIGKQIVDRANRSITEFGPIFGALGLLDSADPAVMNANMGARKEDTADARERRHKLREAIAFKVYEFDTHGVEMNQRYASDAVLFAEGDRHSFTEDAELVYQAACMPGVRLPHVWLVKRRQNYSSLDLVGQGRFTLLTGIGGEGWRKAADAATAALGVPVTVLTVGPDCNYEDPFGDWARIRGVEDDGAVLVRPDQFVAWRSMTRADEPAALLTAALRRILRQPQL
jgi:2,4-dichlorophenol 6-monooxygenase